MQKLGNKLVGRRQKIQGPKQIEIKLISKKKLKKRNVEKKQLIGASCKAI